jgi:G:T/U-mismatch repair DNA glycosylase
MYNAQIERHPLPPFYPDGAEYLFLGSFPPKHRQWTMDFFYPNFLNDMWRIFGLIFFDDKNHFIIEKTKSFDKTAIVQFLSLKRIAIYDMAEEILRLTDNSSDKDLEIVRTLDIFETIDRLPCLRYIVTTGQKASETLIQQLHNVLIPIPDLKVGEDALCYIRKRYIRIARMPSSSRAYSLPLEKKAMMYKSVFCDPEQTDATPSTVDIIKQ